MKQRWSHIALLLLCMQWVLGLNAQERLTLSQYLNWVASHHPIAVNANLSAEIGQLAVTASKGAFDPQLMASYAQKSFDQKSYYQQFNAGIKAPTRLLGVALETGYLNNEGAQLNPESYTPTEGLIYAGVAVPLGQGLVTDARRTALKQAQVIQQQTDAARRQAINELLLKAGKAWYQWYAAYEKVLIYEDAFDLANTRFDAIKAEASLGNRPNIDTLEAGIQVQRRSLLLQQAELSLANTAIAASLFLWDENQQPVYLIGTTRPWVESENDLGISMDSIKLAVDSLISNHPSLAYAKLQLDYQELELNWKREQIKPGLNLKYHYLASPSGEGIPPSTNWSNHQLGLAFNMPILLRNERATWRQSEMILRQSEQALLFKRQDLINDFRQATNEADATSKQLSLANRMLQNQQRLVQGESALFGNGESSLFMVNAREMNYIKSRVTALDVEVSNRISMLKVAYATGQLQQLVEKQ